MICIYMSYYDRLPKEIKNYIGYFIPYKKRKHIYLSEYEEILIDWYNQYNNYDETICRTFKDFKIKNKNLKEFEITLLLAGFKNHFKNRMHYHNIFCPHFGQFRQIPKRKAYRTSRKIHITYEDRYEDE